MYQAIAALPLHAPRALKPWELLLWSVLSRGDGGLSELGLVKLSKAGGKRGKEAYSELVRRHQEWLVRYLLYLIHDPGRAEDLAQEVFVRGYLRIHQHRGGSFRGWLRRIATNLAFNELRDGKVSRDNELASTSFDEHLQGPDGQLEARDALLRALGRVGYSTREVLVLRFVEELSVAEIAQTLKIGESAAKMRLLRARQEFAAVWNQEVGDEAP